MQLTLRPYQKAILDKFKHLASIGLFMGTGTGKTITSLAKVISNETKNLLVICPHSVISQWEDVINKYFSDNFKVLPLPRSWSAKRKNDALLNMGEYNTVIVNFDIIGKLENLEHIIDENWSIIVDESHRIKNMGTKRKPIVATKSVLKLRDKTPYKIILTATPTQGQYGGYIEYYPQLYFLGYIDMSFEEFQRKHVRYKNVSVPGIPYPIKTVAGYVDTKAIDEILETCCVRYVAKFGDFEEQHIKIEIEKPKKYAETARERTYKDITFNNVSRRLVGLRTLCTGTIVGMDFYGEHKSYKDNTNKIDWLRDFLKDTDEVVAIYYQYNIELESLKELMNELGKKYIVINGQTKDKYSEINNKDYDVMLGQFQAASESLDGLQHKCHIVVFFALPNSSLHYLQVLGRINRVGQTKVPMYYYLVTKGTIESDIYNMIEQKVEFSEEVLNKLLLDDGDKNIVNENIHDK